MITRTDPMILVGKIVYKNYLILSCLMDKKYNKLMLGGKSGKNLKGKSKNIYYLVYSIVFLLYACHSNQIRFAPETNTIYTVDNYPIRKLNVVMENAKLNFSITRVDTLEGSPYIKLDSIGDNYEIVPEQAEAVRLIFNEYEHGTSVPTICRMLKEKGYPMPGGQNKVWDESRIHYMIANEKYAGDLLTQKYYKKSFMDYRVYRNEGQLTSKLLKKHHEAIIPRAQFNRCNVILELRKKSTPSDYPFANFLRCPYCGHVLKHRRLEIQNVDSHYCCEGEGACREFVIMAIPLKKAILAAYNDLDLSAVRKIAGQKSKRKAEEAEKLLKVKEEHPAFDSIEYWWLDDLIANITLGQHSYTASDLALMEDATAKAVDDRTVTITWKCGLVTTLPSGVLRDSQHPRHKAILWDGYLLRYPDRHPALTEEARRKQEAK